MLASARHYPKLASLLPLEQFHRHSSRNVAEGPPLQSHRSWSRETHRLLPGRSRCAPRFQPLGNLEAVLTMPRLVAQCMRTTVQPRGTRRGQPANHAWVQIAWDRTSLQAPRPLSTRGSAIQSPYIRPSESCPLTPARTMLARGDGAVGFAAVFGAFVPLDAVEIETPVREVAHRALCARP